MNRRACTRTATSIGVAVASLAVGIVGARALHSNDSSADTTAASERAPVLADSADAAATVDAAAATSIDELIPVLQPVAVGTDPKLADRLLFPPDDRAGTDEDGDPAIPSGMSERGEPAIDGAIPPPEGIDASGAPIDPTPISDDEATPPGTGGVGETPTLGDPPLPPTPLYFDADGSMFPFPFRFIDPCAGATPRPPEVLPPPYCPEGVGGTVTGEEAAAPFNAWISIPHSLDRADDPEVVGCPADTRPAGAGEQAASLVSSAPIGAATMFWRPRGSTGAWESQTLDPSSIAAQGSEWDARVAAGTITAESFGLIVHCLTFPRDLNRPYEAYATGTDSDGRPFTTIVVTLPDLTPEGRPPSTVTINSRLNQATITSWTDVEGSVHLQWYPLAAGEEPPAENCESRVEFPITLRSTGGPTPEGVWDTRYRTGTAGTFEMPAGGGAVVCATIYDTDNTLRPLATDVFVVHGPRRQVATIDLMGVRINDGQTIDGGHLSVAAKYDAEYVADDGCSSWWTNSDTTLTAPGLATGEAVLWSCAYTPLPVDDRGYVKVPITVTRRLGISGSDPYRRMTIGLPLQFDDCTRGVCPSKPNEYYEIPIPTNDMSLRGCVFDCGRPPPSSGVAIVRVTYEVVGAGNIGSSVLLASSDRGADPASGAPRIRVAERSRFTPGDGHRFSELRAEYTTFSDRPVTLVGGRVLPQIVEGSRCAGERPIEVLTTGAVTEPRFAVTIACPATVYTVLLTVRDAVGVEREVSVVYDRAPMVVGRNVTTTIDFLGDSEGHEAGFLYTLDVGIDGSSAVTTRGAWTWSNRYPSDPRYLCVAHGLTTARSAHPIGELFLLNPEFLGIGLSANFTSVCDNSGSGRGAIGEVSMGGTVDIESLQDSEAIVITSPSDARLQVRITVTASSWRLSE